METLNTYFGTADVTEFFSGDLLQRAAGQRGAEVAQLVGDGRSIGIQLADRYGWTFRAQEGKVVIEDGTEAASLLITTDESAWSDLITEAWSIMGLAIQGRVTIERGSFNHLAKWEPALQGLYNDRPIWPPTNKVVTADYVFSMEDDFDDKKKALAELGFLLIKDVFSEEEIMKMKEVVESRRIKATPEDKRSWWATDVKGEEQCCRVTYLNYGSKLFSDLPYDPRLSYLSSLSSVALLPAPDHGDGVAAVIKVPGILEGLSDLPWHRDCGMGGHPLLCPGLNIGIQLDRASEETGQLKFLPGSNNYAGGADHADLSPSTIPVDANPGDVTVHYGHTLHIAPPPRGADTYRRTVYVSFHIPEYQSVLPEGQGYNDVLFSHGDGRVRSPQERI